MLTPEEAEKLATSAVENYVNACGCRNTEDVANVLMKLASMAGLAMCATVGQPEAVARMEGTARHIAKPQFSGAWKLQKAN